MKTTPLAFVALFALILHLDCPQARAQGVTSEADIKHQLGLDKPATGKTRSFRGGVVTPPKVEERTSVATTRSLQMLKSQPATRGAIKIQETGGDTTEVKVPVLADVKATFNNILFLKGSTEFANRESQEQVSTIANVMAEASGKRFLIEGHASDEGEENFNLRLSVARAEAVEIFLLNHGVKPDQIVAQGFGESDQAFPVSQFDGPDAKEAKRQKNRRVVVRVQADHE